MKPLYVFMSLLLIMNGALFADEIYQYQDKNGAMVFTNKPVKNAKKVNLPPLSVYAAPMTEKDYNSSSLTGKATNPQRSSSGLAKIYVKDSSPSFGTNEAGRQQVLSDELDYEKQALKDAKQALINGQGKLTSEQKDPQAYQARIQGLKDAVTEHEKNIDILSRQLGRNN